MAVAIYVASRVDDIFVANDLGFIVHGIDGSFLYVIGILIIDINLGMFVIIIVYQIVLN